MAAQSSSNKILSVLLLICGMLMTLFLYWTFFLNPNLHAIRGSWEEKSRLTTGIRSLEDKLQKKPDLERELSRLQQEGENLQLLIPSTEALPQALGNLEQLLEAAPVTIVTFKAGAIEKGERYAQIPFDLNLSGSDADLMALLEDLETFQHFLVIEQVNWQRSGTASQLNLKVDLIFLAGG